MKKLSLEMLRLSTNEILERSQMKKITGGYGGTCGYKDSQGRSWCGLSSYQAQNYASSGGYWCCDSCASNGGSASYC